jgi:hypothetical protein
LYHPDYKLLFNGKIFPEDLLKGKNVGEHFICEYGLFDPNVKPQNILLSKTNPDASHTIQFEIGGRKRSVESLQPTATQGTPGADGDDGREENKT